MVFNAAKDLVYTMNGGNISSGGYRISKILNGKSKKMENIHKTEEDIQAFLKKIQVFRLVYYYYNDFIIIMKTIILILR